MDCPHWLRNAVIYQVFSGRWELEPHVGFFDQFRSVPWKKLHEIGFNTVYFLGVWDFEGPVIVMEEEGKDLTQVEARTSSMMSIRNHKRIDARLGHEANFLKLVEHLHQQGMRVMVDFVPNHTSTVHPWVSEHPEFYHWKDGEMIREFSGDVAKLNYGNAQLREKMIGILEHVASWGIDGVRCDMAHLIPWDFWEEATGRVKSTYPEFGFVAESYPHSIFDYSNLNNLFKGGFDAVYDSGLYTNFIQVIVDMKPPSQIVEHMNAIPHIMNGMPVHYWGNHDDPTLGNRRWEEDEYRAQLGDQFGAAMLAVVLFFSSGIPLVYNGSMVGLHRRLGHHWVDMLAKDHIEAYMDIPVSLKKIWDIFKQYQNGVLGHSPNEIFMENQLLSARYIFEDGYILHIWVNVTRTSSVISTAPDNYTGLLLGKKKGDSLGTGEVEIFVYR